MRTERTATPGAAPVKEHTSETAASEETDVALRVTRDVWLDRNGVHTAYRAGQVVPAGHEARELLARRPSAVARLDRPFVVCPNWRCCSPILIEHVHAAGQLVVEDAAEAMVPLHLTVDVSHIDLRAGDLLELKLEPSRARELRTLPAFRPSGQSIFRVRCENCRGTVLVAVSKA